MKHLSEPQDYYIHRWWNSLFNWCGWARLAIQNSKTWKKLQKVKWNIWKNGDSHYVPFYTTAHTLPIEQLNPSIKAQLKGMGEHQEKINQIYPLYKWYCKNTIKCESKWNDGINNIDNLNNYLTIIINIINRPPANIMAPRAV